MSYKLYYHKYPNDFFFAETALNGSSGDLLCERDALKLSKLKDHIYRTEFLLIRLMFEEILKANKLPWKVSDLRYSAKGKPYFFDQKENGVDFSFAHTNGIVAVILANDEVGLDVECCDYKAREISSFLTPMEVEQIAKDNKHFWDIWTKKESSVKLEGSTLARFRRYCTIENPSGYYFSTLDLDTWKFCVSSKKRIQEIETIEIKKIPLLQ